MFECVTSYAHASRSALPVPALLEVIKGMWCDQPGLDSLLPLAVEASLPATGEKQLLLSVSCDLMDLQSCCTPCTITRCSLCVVQAQHQGWGSSGGRFFGSDGQDDMRPPSPFPGSRPGVPGMCHFVLAAAGVLQVAA